MEDRKQGLRAKASWVRESLPRSQAYKLGRLVEEAAIGFAPYLDARSVGLYRAIGNEVSTDRIMGHAVRSGKVVYYPGSADAKDPFLIRLRSARDSAARSSDIPESVGDPMQTECDPEGLVVFIPGLAFDFFGARLGRGRGWYDRLLAKLRRATRVGLAYEFQLLDQIPVDALDERVHYLITESRIIDCRAVAAAKGEVRLNQE